jgi:hypothetical protein
MQQAIFPYFSRRDPSIFHRGGGCQGLPTSRTLSKSRHINQRYGVVVVTPRRPAGIVSPSCFVDFYLANFMVPALMP